MYRIHYKKIIHSGEGDFKILVKMGIFFKKFMAYFKEHPKDEGDITCMNLINFIVFQYNFFENV